MKAGWTKSITNRSRHFNLLTPQDTDEVIDDQTLKVVTQSSRIMRKYITKKQIEVELAFRWLHPVTLTTVPAATGLTSNQPRKVFCPERSW